MNQVLFKDLNLSDEIIRSIDEMNFIKATEIQSKSIPIIKKGYDVIGKSQTGTGKTIAFGIPAVELITNDGERFVQVLILCPTRELVLQSCNEIRKLSKFRNGVKVADVYGGTPIDKQIRKLKTSNIVIGTPGRIMDHIRRKTLKLNNVKMVILDEADEMLNMGFREDIEYILNKMPSEKQTILFSATMPPEILDLTNKFQKSPKIVSVDNKNATLKNISQYYYNVKPSSKMDSLYNIIKYTNPKLSVIFCNTKKTVNNVTKYLCKKGIAAEAIHGDMKQYQRTNVMKSFKLNNTNILVATDVAARGIDVPGIDYVINYDIPQNIEYYIHRIGRTGRAGKSGNAITLCEGNSQIKNLMQIAKATKSDICFKQIPYFENIAEKNKISYVDAIESFIKNNSRLKYKNIVKELNLRGYSSDMISASVVEMYIKTQNDIL